MIQCLCSSIKDVLQVCNNVHEIPLALKLSLCRKTDCTFCKTPLPTVLFSRSPDTPFPSENHLEPSPPNAIAKAQEEAKKGERWDKGLTLPGTLDLGAFPYVDEKLGVVFEDEDMVCRLYQIQRFS